MSAPLSPMALECVRLSVESCLAAAVARGFKPARDPEFHAECCATTAYSVAGYGRMYTEWLGLDVSQEEAIERGWDGLGRRGGDPGLHALGRELAAKWIDGVSP